MCLSNMVNLTCNIYNLYSTCIMLSNALTY